MTGYGGVYDYQYRLESRAYEDEHASDRPPHAAPPPPPPAED